MKSISESLKVYGLALLALMIVGTCPSHAQNTSSYKISPSDILSIEVFQEPTLTKELRVNTSGKVSYPLIGKI